MVSLLKYLPFLLCLPLSAQILPVPNGGTGTNSVVATTRYVAGGGSANAQTATYSPPLASLVTGTEACWLPTAANTTTTPTFAPNGLTAKTITKLGTTALVANDLTTTAIACARYDGTEWQLQNPQTTAATSNTFPVFKQYTFVVDSTAANVTSPSITVASGDTLVVSCRFGTGAVGTATDSQSNSYSAQAAHNNGTTGNQVSIATAGSSGSITFTCTQSGSAAGISLIALDYSGTLGSVNVTTGSNAASGPGANVYQTSAVFSTTGRTLTILCESVGSISGNFGAPTTAGQFGYGTGIVRGASLSTITANGADQGCTDNISPVGIANQIGSISYSANLGGNNYAQTVVAINY